jgi:RecB family exonuclease
MHQELFDPRAEVEQIEFSIRFPYPHVLKVDDGSSVRAIHSFEAKIDRLDRMPGGGAGHRIVDYKTGEVRKKLLEPAGDDLQLGIYAMALRHHQGGERREDAEALLETAAGVAEYWVLSSGQRGEIDLAEIDYAGIKSQIDKALTGMLSGPFGRGEIKRGGCWDLCQMFVGG